MLSRRDRGFGGFLKYHLSCFQFSVLDLSSFCVDSLHFMIHSECVMNLLSYVMILWQMHVVVIFSD